MSKQRRTTVSQEEAGPDALEMEFGSQDDDEGEGEGVEEIEGLEGLGLPDLGPPPGYAPNGAPMIGHPAFTASPPARFTTPRTTTPPLWAGAAMQGATGLLKIQRLENSRPVDIGELTLGANDSDLLNTWPKAGTYWITPVDLHGKRLADTVEKTYSEDHQVLRAHRVTMAASQPLNFGGFVQQAPAMPALPPEYTKMLEELRADVNRRAEQEREEVAAEKKVIAAERAKLAEKELHLAVHNGAAAAELQQRVLSNEQERAQQAQAHLLAIFKSEQDAQNNRWERERQLERDRAESERQRWEREQVAAKAQAAEERERRAQDDTRRREEDANREKLRLEAAERQRDQDREHVQMMMTSMQLKAENSNPLNQLETIVAAVVPLIGLGKELGIIGAPAQAAADNKSWIQEGIALLTALANAKATADHKAMVEGGHIAPPQEEGPTDEDLVEIPRMPQLTTGPIVEQRPGRVPVSPDELVGIAPAPLQAVPPPTRTVAERIALLPEIQQMAPDQARDARRAVRDLVGKLKHIAVAEWKETIMTALLKTPIVINYCAGVSVYWAIVEGGADDALASRITDAVFADELIPAGFPKRRELAS